VILETLESWWNSLIEFSSQFIIPDWDELVALLPILLLIGVAGPLLTLTVLFWLRYVVRRPSVRLPFAPRRRAAPLDAEGRPVFPVGEPYSLAEGVVYEPGETRSESGDALLVACPKCTLVRPAAEPVCGNCGLAFTLTPATRSIQPAGPPPGGRSAA
jgi:hypothetical protein